MSGKNSDGYLVKQVKEMCTDCTKDLALEMCTQSECKELCYHMYTCDKHCYDNTNGHLCKHIHRAHSLWLEASEPNYQCHQSTCLGSGFESVSDTDDPLEFAENVRNLSTGMYKIHYLNLHKPHNLMQTQRFN